MTWQSKLEAFVASLPSKKTSEMLELLYVNDRHYGSHALYLLVGVGTGLEESRLCMREARDAMLAEIDRRIPTSQA
jgi:hypothetical protein